MGNTKWSHMISARFAWGARCLGVSRFLAHHSTQPVRSLVSRWRLVQIHGFSRRSSWLVLLQTRTLAPLFLILRESGRLLFMTRTQDYCVALLGRKMACLLSLVGRTWLASESIFGRPRPRNHKVSGRRYLVDMRDVWPKKSQEPADVGAPSSAVSAHVTSRRWLSFLYGRPLTLL